MMEEVIILEAFIAAGSDKTCCGNRNDAIKLDRLEHMTSNEGRGPSWKAIPNKPDKLCWKKQGQMIIFLSLLI